MGRKDGEERIGSRRAGGRRNTGPLGGDVPGYRTGRRRRGGGGGRTLIRFGTYNIRNGRNGGLELALRGMGKSNVDVGVFQETKLMEGIYTRILDGYKVVTMLAPRRHHRGLALFYQDPPAFVVEVICQFGVNVITCQLATGERRWYIVGCHLAPGYKTMIRDVEAAMAERPRGTEFIVTGDFNVEFKKTGGRGRDEDIAAAVATAGLEDLEGNLLLQRRAWCKNWRKWDVVRQGRVVRSWTYCILGSDSRMSRTWPSRTRGTTLTISWY